MNDRAAPPAVSVIRRHVHHARVELPATGETAAEARQRLGDKFPRATLRRMTHLGLLLGSVLEGVVLTADDAVVYASTFAETRALEDYLASFPTASPALFQTSIHPGAVQQVLIGRRQPVARLWPLASRTRLVEQALVTALLEPAEQVVVLGGEERGTWMLENGMASDRSFAFGLVLTRQAAGAIAEVTLAPSGSRPSEPGPSLIDFAEALASHRPIRWATEAGTLAVEFR